VASDLPDEFPSLRGATVQSASELGAPAGERLVVADDSVLLREGLVRLLRDAGFAVVGTAADAEDLLEKVAELRPSVAITDIRMPPTQTDEGLVAAHEIRRLYPEMGVLVLSEHIEPRYATALLEEYPERTGYLLKGRVSDVAVLTDAIHRISRGECVVDPTIVSRLMNRRRRGGALGALTDDERDLLALVAEGHSNESIADRVGADADAIERGIADVFGKLEIDTSPDDVRRALSVLASIRS